MKLILLLLAFIKGVHNAEYTRVPEPLVDQLVNIIDTTCDCAPHILHDNSETTVQARSVIGNKLEMMFNDVEQMFVGLFDKKLLYNDVSFGIVYVLCKMASQSAFGGYFEKNGHIPSEKNNAALLAQALKDEQVLDSVIIDMINNFSYDKCRGKRYNDWILKERANNGIITAGRPFILKNILVDNTTLKKYTIDSDTDEYHATQIIVNPSNQAQSVTINKEFTRSLTRLVSTSTGWTFEVSESISLSAGTPLYKVALDIGMKAGNSRTQTESNSASNTVVEKFAFNLQAPPCSKVTADLKLEKTMLDYKISQVFDFGGNTVTINGTVIERNLMAQEFIITKIEKLGGCGNGQNTGLSTTNYDLFPANPSFGRSMADPTFDRFFG